VAPVSVERLVREGCQPVQKLLPDNKEMQVSLALNLFRFSANTTLSKFMRFYEVLNWKSLKKFRW
jgi:hypothetical protein